jgi:hypothetical protein
VGSMLPSFFSYALPCKIGQASLHSLSLRELLVIF